MEFVRDSVMRVPLPPPVYIFESTRQVYKAGSLVMMLSWKLKIRFKFGVKSEGQQEIGVV